MNDGELRTIDCWLGLELGFDSMHKVERERESEAQRVNRFVVWGS